MNLTKKRILLTGATGGIGKQLAKQLARHDCKLALTGRDESKLEELTNELNDSTCSDVFVIPADFTKPEHCHLIVNQACEMLGGLDILINLAGLQTFKSLTAIEDIEIQQQLTINLQAPIILAREASKLMCAQESGQIVNVGSTFGTIAFAHFSVYSAAKFGLRGFSEALRRELKDSGVDVNYIAPRATLTRMNSNKVYEMAEATGMNLDSPQKVANEIITAITRNKKNHYIGFPEKLFARINAVLPSLVDKALYRQNRIARKFV